MANMDESEMTKHGQIRNSKHGPIRNGKICTNQKWQNMNQSGPRTFNKISYVDYLNLIKKFPPYTELR